MREIKFRVWDNWNKKYVNQKEYIIDFLGNVFRIKNREIVAYENYEQMNIEQYTGLTDKNGVEIYEGDTLAPYKAKVVWNDRLGGWCGQHKNDGDMWLLFIDLHNLEVVGNIHE